MIRKHTRLYADDAFHERIHTVDGPADPLRFFFDSALDSDPPLAPVGGTASMRLTAAHEARRSFAEDIRERGVRNLQRTRSERLRTEAGDRVRVMRYRGRGQAGEETVGAAGYIGIWTTNREFRLAGGGYPEERIEDLDHDPSDSRDTLFDLTRTVR
jgi:hypothetical protein